MPAGGPSSEGGFFPLSARGSLVFRQEKLGADEGKMPLPKRPPPAACEGYRVFTEAWESTVRDPMRGSQSRSRSDALGR